MLAAEGPLDDPQRRVPRQTLGEHRGALDTCGCEPVAPPLVRDLMRHHGERKIDVPRIVAPGSAERTLPRTRC